MDLLGFTWIFIYFSFLGKRSSNPLYPDYVPTILVQTTPKQEFKRVEKLKRDSQKLDSDIKKRNQTTKMWSSKRYFQFHMRGCNCWKLVRKKLGFLFYLSAKQEWVVFHGFFFVFLQNKISCFSLDLSIIVVTLVYFTVENVFFIQYIAK